LLSSDAWRCGRDHPPFVPAKRFFLARWSCQEAAQILPETYLGHLYEWRVLRWKCPAYCHCQRRPCHGKISTRRQRRCSRTVRNFLIGHDSFYVLYKIWNFWNISFIQLLWSLYVGGGYKVLPNRFTGSRVCGSLPHDQLRWLCLLGRISPEFCRLLVAGRVFGSTNHT